VRGQILHDSDNNTIKCKRLIAFFQSRHIKIFVYVYNGLDYSSHYRLDLRSIVQLIKRVIF